MNITLWLNNHPVVRNTYEASQFDVDLSFRLPSSVLMFHNGRLLTGDEWEVRDEHVIHVVAGLRHGDTLHVVAPQNAIRAHFPLIDARSLSARAAANNELQYREDEEEQYEV